jgi:hypothetical protein
MAPVVIFTFAIVMSVAAALQVRAFSDTSCPTIIPNGHVPTGAFTAVIGAFFLGGMLGKLKHVANPHEPAGVVAQVGLTVLCGTIAVAWGYETLAVARPLELHPITYYIMCIKGTTNDISDWTVLLFMIGALLAGRWLWHREGAFI